MKTTNKQKNRAGVKCQSEGMDEIKRQLEKYPLVVLFPLVIPAGKGGKKERGVASSGC